MNSVFEDKNKQAAFQCAREILYECDLTLDEIRKGDYLFIIHTIIDSKLLDIDIPVLDSQISKWNRQHEKKPENRQSAMRRHRKTRACLKKYLRDTIEYVSDNELVPIPKWSESQREELIKELRELGNNIYCTDDPKYFLGAVERCLLLGDREIEARSGARGGIIYIVAGRND